MSITGRILSACFTGGATFVAIAVLIPGYWYLAALPSFVVGYLGYNLATVGYHLPTAWRAACSRTKKAWAVGDNFADSLTPYLGDFIHWLKTPHPFLYPAVVMFLGIATANGWFTHNWTDLLEGSLALFFARILSLTILYTMLTLVLMGVLFFLAVQGLRTIRKECFYDKNEASFLMTKREMKQLGLTGRPASYGSVCIFAVAGFFIAVWTIVKLVAEFVIYLIRLIHSSERLVCGTASVIGGATVYVTFVGVLALDHPLPVALLIANGGLAGALIGYLDWHYLRPWLMRLLKAETAPA